MKTLIVLLTFVILGGCSGKRVISDNSVVIEVIDGDTIKIDNGEVVRLLGIDAPEKGEEGYFEAVERLREMVEDKEIRLLASNNSSNRDKYGRLLRYVYLEGGNESINDILLREGYVAVYGR